MDDPAERVHLGRREYDGGRSSIVIGVGNRTSPTAGGTGILFIDDVGYGRTVGQ